MNRVRAGLAALVNLSVLMTNSTVVSALQINGDVAVDARYSDNAGLTSDNEKEDLITTARVAAAISEDDGPLTGSATAALRKLYYKDNSFSDQTYFSLGSNARWEQLSNRLVWSVYDYYSQTSIDSLEANTPDNTEDTNAFSVSVAVNIPVADRHKITVSPTFRDFYYESSSNDNQQVGVTAGWTYQLDPTISLSLNGGFSDVDYDDDISNPDYEKTNLNIAMDVTRARSRYQLSIGTTKVDRDTGSQVDGMSGNISWQYDFTGRSSIIAHASSDITDTSNIFLTSSIDPNTGSSVNVQDSSDVVRDSVLRLTYKRRGSVVDSSLWTEFRDLDYETTMLDREVQEVGANISYAISSYMTGSVSGSYTRTKETAITSTDKGYSVSGSLDYRLSRKLTANVGMGVKSKDSSGVASREYDELNIFAGIGYRLGR